MKYKVKAGDTLYGISKKNNLSTAELLKLNNWNSPPSLQINQEIIVGKSSDNQPTPKVSIQQEELTYKVVQGDSLYAISRKFNTTPPQILEYNKLNNNAGLYSGQILKIPTKEENKETVKTIPTSSNKNTHLVEQGESLYGISRKYGTTPQAILSANGLDNNAPLYIGQELSIPTNSNKTPKPTPSPKPIHVPKTEKSLTKKIYTVQQGDTLYQISRKVGISPQKLLEINGLDGSVPIYIGQELEVKQNATSTPEPTINNSHTVQRGESLYAISKKYNCTPASILAKNGLAVDATIYVGQKLLIPSKDEIVSKTPSRTPSSSKQIKIHTVQSGDYISKIAKKYNISPQQLVAANHLPKGRIYVGQQLVIPTTQSTVSNNNTNKTVSNNTSSSLKNQQGRSIYQLSKVDGKASLPTQLRSAIGIHYNMNSNDVKSIQNRLIQLNCLATSHNENIQSLASNGVVSGNRIPKTLAAIKQLQNKYKLNWWVENSTRSQMLGTNKFKYGEIHSDDITFKFLREYTEYKLQFPQPISGSTEVAEFKNFVRSGYNQYYDGVGYIGKSLPTSIPLKVYTDVGLSTTLAQAMQIVSSHEGNFDAINSYDKAFFSYGFIQFAGGGRGLAPVIARMKVSQPALFKAIFQAAGIDVTYTMRNNDIHQGELIIQFPNKGTLKGVEAEKELRGDHQLYGPFIRAAFHPDLIKAQIEQSVKAYAKPALGIKLNIQTNGFKSSAVPLTDFINSAMGLGFAIDMTVNKWIVKTGQMFSDAINHIARKRGFSSYEQLALIDEKEVIQEIVNKEGPADKRVADRGKSMINSGLSFAKSPAKGKGMIA